MLNSKMHIENIKNSLIHKYGFEDKRTVYFFKFAEILENLF